MKKIICTLLICVIFISSVIPLHADNETIMVKLNNMLLSFDTAPMSVQGRTLVPLRTIFEELGMEVTWDGATKTISGKKGGVEIKLQQDSKTAYVNGNQVLLDVPAQAIHGRILVPVRFIAESTGSKVFWEEKSRTIYISTSNDETLTLDRILTSSNFSSEGWKQKQAGKIEDALKYFQSAIELDPFNCDAYYYQGVMLEWENKYEEALKCLDTALQINPKTHLLQQSRANLLFKLEKYKEAAKSFDEIAKSGKNRYMNIIPNMLGDKLFYEKNYEDSILFYDIAIKYFPDKADKAYFNKAVSLHYLFRYEEALQNYNNAIEINPKFSFAYSNKGNVYKDLGKLEDAIKCYDKAIELTPEETEPYVSKGIALLTYKRYAEALDLFDKSIEMGVINENVFNLKGNTLLALGKTVEALACYNKAIELNNRFAVTYFNKAVLYANLDNENEALANLKKAIELDSEYKNIARNWPDFKNLKSNTEFNKLVNQ